MSVIAKNPSTLSMFDLVWQMAQSHESNSIKELVRSFVTAQDRWEDSRKDLFNCIDGLSSEMDRRQEEMLNSQAALKEEVQKMFDEQDDRNDKLQDKISDELSDIWQAIGRLENLIPQDKRK